MMSLNPYAFLINLKNFLYDGKYIKQYHSGTPVISIGNLNTGGSGKTPMTQFLASLFPEKKILIVCRSYKAKLTGPACVDLSQPQAARYFGDEACLLKQLLPHCEVWSGPSKTQTVREALNAEKFDLIIIDDGFSHRKLFRNKDIVLFDLSRDQDHYQLFPFGQMREDWKTLKRSDLVILTKFEGLTENQIHLYKAQIETYQKRIIFAHLSTTLDSENKKIFLVTGLGNPQKLKSNLEKLGYEIVKFKFYADHYEFPDHEQLEILKQIQLNPELQLVMTAKDRIKITRPELFKLIQCAELSVSLSESDRKIFYDTILS